MFEKKKNFILKEQLELIAKTQLTFAFLILAIQMVSAYNQALTYTNACAKRVTPELIANPK